MSTVDAQCLIVHLSDSEPPAHWHHGPADALTWRFAAGSNTYTWDAAAVREAAGRWAACGRARPAAVAMFVAAHERLLGLVHQAGGPQPDVVVHDLDARTVTGLWNAERQAVVIDDIPEVGSSASVGGPTTG